jgi:hypothetical protein
MAGALPLRILEYASLTGGMGTAMLATDGAQMLYIIALFCDAVKVDNVARTLEIESLP